MNGTKVANLAEVSTSGTGALVTAFGHTANGQVETLLGVKGHILAGGYYTTINGSTKKYMTSLSPTTGKDDGFISLNISGNYNFPGAGSNGTRVYNQSLSNGGTLDLVMGDFTSVGGQGRQQIFMLNLATSPATVTPWTSPEWDGSQGEATPSDPTQAIRSNAPGTSRSTSRRRHGRRLTRRSTLAPPATTRSAGRSGDTAERAVRRRRGLPGDPGLGTAHVGELHRLRLALLGGGRCQHRVLRRARAVVNEPERL